ncbi:MULTISPECIES: DUF2231 domain-containing protein [Kosakonia]|jgi:uncharacterized membrane protein|uniref:DUF2231 domain-containing protein n=2 Tax=Enterobacteriaceae TaxID=543 RepID=A0A807LI06_9ENTR|nr:MULTISPECIES: DUF2231 domain-containing protein [Kosakonia]ESS58277.1 putative membrane protein [Enterobacter cloacae S611]MBS5774200.1 hypothetical protein [Enterobacter cloacae]MDP9769562.1 putative membrane protein [Atlantibacter hermannii]MDV5355656.1 hypothetical protein [Enterobacter asburiae]APZ05690.1 hypothetical protein BWI95_11865 [Kosakonia cowanii JCM 10956 = DSM 18146]
MQTTSGPSRVAIALYELLNPLPLGFFTAAWIFDILYLKSFQIMWTDAASWLIAIGLVLAIVPRLINLVQVWFTQRPLATAAVKIHFWLWLLAIVLAIFNAFVHSRDAYAVVPLGVILSTAVVALLLIANVQLALRTRKGVIA